MDIITQIDKWGLLLPEKFAHVSAGRGITYAQLRKSSDVLASHLMSTLADDHSPVVVLGHKEPELIIAFLAIIKSGHPYVPIDNTLPTHRIEGIVTASGAQLILTPEIIAKLVTELPSTNLAPSKLMRPEDPFYIMFTSGSTGTPKGVVITLGGLISFMKWTLSEHELKEKGEIWLNQVPFSFDVSIMSLYPSLYLGGTHISITKEEVANPPQLYGTFSDSAVTVWVSTPSFIQLCLAERRFNAEMLPKVWLFMFCGETLAPDLAAELLKRFPQAEIWNTYGPTEATVATTSVRIDQNVLAKYSPLPIGYPMLGSQVLVVGEDGKVVPEGERGEIIIAGPNVSPGYLGRPDLTAKAFFVYEGKPAYHTGDWGRARDGMLFFEGRRDNQIKLHGHRIELGDVEANLQALAGIRDAVVVLKSRDGVPERLAAFIIFAERPAGSNFQLSLDLRRRLGERLPTYMVPQTFKFVDAYPMTVNGKADRRKLMEMLD